MGGRKKIYTLRPYYIDCERLYDVYSTMMDGYADSQEVVEITKSSIQRGRKLSVTGEFSVTSLLANGLSTTLLADVNKARENGRDLQVKSTRRLPPIVLLNWLLDKMENDSQIIEISPHWWNWQFSLKEDSVGKPIIVKGVIKSNSAKTIKKLNIYPNGIRGVLMRFLDSFSKDFNMGREIKKYILIPNRDYKTYRILHEVRIVFALLEELQSNLSGEIRDNYLTIRISLNAWLDEFNYSPYRYSHTEKLTQIKDDIRTLDRILERESTMDESMRRFQYLFHELRSAISEFEYDSTRNNSDSLKQRAYTFDLNKQMYCHADRSDILSASQINCFGLIKNIGINMYELEVIALYT